MDPFELIHEQLAERSSRIAFRIQGKDHTYAELADAVAGIRERIQARIPDKEKVVGLAANDDLGTYAAILALWAEGKAYVPVVTSSPEERNRYILDHAGARTLLSTTECDLRPDHLIRVDGVASTKPEEGYKKVSDEELAYILFTSGTTGKPKGVPISRSNLTTFCNAFEALVPGLTEQDRCLQMFDLTFDLSVMSYMIPLTHGACVNTVPKEGIKYSAIAEILEDDRITIALMVPSIINYLRPYFHELDLPLLKHSLFCGEALPLDVLSEWSRCVPNARILNVYGPTEHTIFCSHYAYDREGRNKERNGVISIGRPMQECQMAVLDGSGRILDRNASGELLLAGGQLTPGYWNDPEKNAATFLTAEYNGAPTRFYKTGDLCAIDEEGDILYLGRTDHQVKVQGFRVELGEVEHHARKFLKTVNTAVVAVQNNAGNTELALFVESPGMDLEPVLEHLRANLPGYMVPTKVSCVVEFPLNQNGKTDKRALQERLDRVRS